MTMTMAEIVDLETGIDHTIEIDHIVEIDHEITIEMITKIIIGITMKMIIGMIIEMITETIIELTTEMTVEKKFIRILKNRNIRESIEIIMKIHMMLCKAECLHFYLSLNEMSRGKFTAYICICFMYCNTQLLIFRFSFLHNP